MAQDTKQIRRAVMHLNLEMLREVLHLPKDVKILTAAPTNGSNLEFNALTILLESNRFSTTELGKAFPTVRARFKGREVVGDGFEFESFEQVEV